MIHIHIKTYIVSWFTWLAAKFSSWQLGEIAAQGTKENTGFLALEANRILTYYNRVKFSYSAEFITLLRSGGLVQGLSYQLRKSICL